MRDTRKAYTERHTRYLGTAYHFLRAVLIATPLVPLHYGGDPRQKVVPNQKYYSKFPVPTTLRS